MPGESFFGVDGLLVALAALTGINYYFRRSILYPPFIFCAVWLLDLFVYRLNLIPVYSLHGITLLVVFFGAFFFGLGGAAGFFVPRSLIAVHIKIAPNPGNRGEKLRYAWLFLLAAGVCFQIRELFAAAGSGFGQGFMASARVAVVANMVRETETGVHGAAHWLDYVTSLAIYTAVLFRLERKDRLFWAATALAVVSCISTTGRAQILMLFSALLCVHLLRIQRETFLRAVSVVRWPVIAFCALFALLAYTNKTAAANSASAGAFVFASVIGYIIGPLPCLDQVLTHLSDYSGLPIHTFAFFERLMVQLGLAHAVPPVSLGDLFVPFFANVYTIYAFFITDFGLPGSMLVIMAIGFLQVLLYRKAHTDSLIGQFLFALTMYPLVMSIFADLYTALGNYLGGILFAMAYLTVRSISLYAGSGGMQAVESS